MSKRCCAKNCFNSVVYNNSIAYFSFPKKREFAVSWAELAGRDDLKQKPLSQIVKYYLCSEHFTANCFVDKDTKQILKRNLPHSIALPSVFKNNLQETMQNANPRNSIEVHNIILLDVDEKPKVSYCPKNQTASNEDVTECCTPDPAVIVRDDFFTYEDSESQVPDTMKAADNLNMEEVLVLPSYEPAESLITCRLCCKDFSENEWFMEIEKSSNLQDFISRVMSDKITVGDSMSQVVCKNCENNALLCLFIIQQMDAAQEKIKLPQKKLMSNVQR